MNKKEMSAVAGLLAVCLAFSGCSSGRSALPTLTPTATLASTATVTPLLPTETPSPTPQELASATPFVPQPQSRQIGSLTLVEYPLVPDDVDIDGSSEIVNQVWDWQGQSVEAASSLTLAEINAVLQPFGYSVSGESSYGLYQGDTMLRDLPYGLPDRKHFSRNNSRTDFVWAIQDTVMDGWLIHGESIESGYSFASNFFVMPTYLGDDLIVLKNNSGSEDPAMQLQVTINDQVVYHQSLDAPAMMVTDCPVEDLQVWNGHWVLNMQEQVVMDGASLNETSGHEAVFDWLLFGGKPLYFFRDQGSDGLVYNGQELPIRYDDIKHQCTSVNDWVRALGIEGGTSSVDFFARRDGMWYYVEVKLPTESVSYASSTAPSGCALEPGLAVHAGENSRAWSSPDVTRAVILRSLDPGQVLYILDGPQSGHITVADTGWFWEVSDAPAGQSIGWLWQSRFQECP